MFKTCPDCGADVVHIDVGYECTRCSWGRYRREDALVRPRDPQPAKQLATG